MYLCQYWKIRRGFPLLLQVFLISKPVPYLSHRLNRTFRPAHQLFSQLRTPYLVSKLKPVTPQVHRHRWWPPPQSWQVRKKRHMFMAKYFTGGLLLLGEKRIGTFFKLLFAICTMQVYSHTCTLNSQPIP